MSQYDCPFKHLLILDFETTSDGNEQDYPFEVIQFSVVVLNVQTNTILDDVVFNKYVRPVHNPILSKYCSDFTGIKQSSLDAADTFDVVYNQFLAWLAKNGFRERTFAIVCDSRQDMWRIAQYQFRLIRGAMPAMFRQWINIKRSFDAGLDDGEREKLTGNTNIERMCNYLGIKAVGKAHDSLSDCLTLARITQNILGTGCPVTINEMLCCSAMWRKQPLNIATCPDWRSDFIMATRVYERILPLVMKTVRGYNVNNYGVCPYCKKGPSVCGDRHKQNPKEFYQGLTKPSVFAKTAQYY